MSLFDQIATRTVVADGAMGTELQALGLPPGTPGDPWCLEYPDRIARVHQAYRDAGCDWLTTNSFGGSQWVLERHGLAGKVGQLNREAARIARGVAGGDVIVAGDIGPSGGLIEPYGPMTVPELTAGFARQAEALLKGGADGIVVETMSDVQEAVAAIAGARQAGAPWVVACLTFNRLPNGKLRTMMGQTPDSGARTLVEAGADVVGANCGTHLGFDDYAAIAREMAAAVRMPVIVMPNAGQPTMDGSRAVYTLTPDAFAAGVEPLVTAGVAIVGGCCGTTPAHLAALSTTVRQTGHRR